MSRPLMSAVAAQQAVVDGMRQTIEAQHKALTVQGQQIALIARLAGVTDEVQGLAKEADIANPAQPIPDPGEQGPSETTEQAATPETNDDVRAPGQTGNSTQGVPAQATDVVLQPGGTIPTPPYNQLQDVTAPVSGTNTGEVGGEQTRIESDVRVGNPMDPTVAFPWTVPPNDSNNAPPSTGEMSQTGGGAKTSHRYYAALRLARLRMQATHTPGDDLMMAASIDTDPALSNEMIDHEIWVLDKVVSSNQAASPSPSAGAKAPKRGRTAARSAPSLAAAPSLSTTAAADPDDAMIFLKEGDLSGI